MIQIFGTAAVVVVVVTILEMVFGGGGRGGPSIMIGVVLLAAGGMLALGDCHAVVGDGAVAGTGAECSSDTQIRVTVEKGMSIPAPRALTPDHFVVLSYGQELGPAMKQAVRYMVDFLVQEKGLAPYDAYTLCSLAGDIRVSRTFRPISPVKMMLSRQALDQLG